MIVVLDACAMIAFLRDEPGAAIVEQYLRNNETLCLAHAINLCEVFYDFIRATGENNANQAIQDLLADGSRENGAWVVRCGSGIEAGYYASAKRRSAPEKPSNWLPSGSRSKTPVCVYCSDKPV